MADLINEIDCFTYQMQIYGFGTSIVYAIKQRNVKNCTNFANLKLQKMKRIILLFGLFIAFTVATHAQTAAEWNKQGVDHAKKFEYAKAFDCFTKAIELKSDFAEAYYNRATVWFELPANTYPNTDGCTDLKKAKMLGYKSAEKKIKEFGCL
jgi:hypothetical protein